MISALIIVASVVLALAYACAWCLNPRFRHQVEQPKHWFQEQLESYDRECQRTAPKAQDPDAD